MLGSYCFPLAAWLRHRSGLRQVPSQVRVVDFPEMAGGLLPGRMQNSSGRPGFIPVQYRQFGSQRDNGGPAAAGANLCGKPVAPGRAYPGIEQPSGQAQQRPVPAVEIARFLIQLVRADFVHNE